ncbi:hypothetical protein COV24_02325 [candidate division WWE3 bacterium CG10_big_fil_rev_8_21_14_0_10_32_10]|uniref:Bacterial bifunctional deaminase-reductase C-terminal domain-containing protein n=1 Tax=candidate division WWE3 bacterium CG10_big_fil_rev_8_21_14_0_10_32_10 TaxID=1975090 RepID=A0A2H0RBW8_UNCKA|nr:MAG: hypothetical protein COV24_02325 [candidate division WWE3 bacterium CG10_big_fil_rev_8_21_14_0_10_32_10]
MHITIYGSISINGYVADLEERTEWVSSISKGYIKNLVENYDAVVLGKHSYEANRADFPYGSCFNVVLSSDSNLYQADQKILFTDKSPKDLVKYLHERGLEKALVIGGGITNTRFLTENIVDEILFSVHPLILGKGVKVFNDFEGMHGLKLIDFKNLNDDLLLMHYEVKK